jgi:hypothetical protein
VLAEKTDFHKQIESGKRILIAELSPPKGPNPDPLQQQAGSQEGACLG